ncbi:hypothetical protein SNE40_017547 [Patella caerulea]|uniref:Uncharacterized protein n=1 Tax=Patella caerulea TaxID=87958 RepID=A0AAN8JF77_PATCE
MKSCNCQFTLKLINKDDDERSLIELGDKRLTATYGLSCHEWNSVIEMDELSDTDNCFIDDEGNFIIQADLKISHIVLENESYSLFGADKP